VIQATITCDFCGESEARGESTTLAKRLWQAMGWRICPDGVAFCRDCLTIAEGIGARQRAPRGPRTVRQIAP
jgi:hypothetical protein